MYLFGNYLLSRTVVLDEMSSKDIFQSQGIITTLHRRTNLLDRPSNNIPYAKSLAYELELAL